MRPIRSLGLLFIVLITASSLTSCINTKKTVYFNNIPDTLLKGKKVYTDPSIQRGDLLSISITSLNPEASVVFNMPGATTAMSPVASGMAGTVGGPQVTGYLVDGSGMIKFPILGLVKAEGLTKKNLEDSLTAVLVEKKLLVDPVVSIRFLNFRVTVIGEVNRPTTINVTNERISLLEALGLAGDLTIYGKRDNILLIRETDSGKVVKRIDINQPDILMSPYYYLSTNDVVYVEPRKEKVLSTSRTQQLLPIIISALGFIAIVVSRLLT